MNPFPRLLVLGLVGLALLAGCHKNSYRPPPAFPVVAPPTGNCPTCPPGQGGFAPAPAGPGFPMQPGMQPAVPADPAPAVPRTGPSISQYPSRVPSTGLDQAAAKLGPLDANRPVENALATGPVEIPTEIPRFALVNDRAAAGLLPFPEGYAWLKAKGYRAVLYVKSPGEDDSMVRDEVAKVGLKYQTLEVSPGLLTKERVETFARVLTEEGPVFVCDRSGDLAGTIWYLHFRLIDRQADDQALPRAQRLGLREPAEGDSAGQALWNAMKQLTP